MNKWHLGSKYKSVILRPREKRKLHSSAATKGKLREQRRWQAKKQIPNRRNPAKQNHNRRNLNTNIMKNLSHKEPILI